MDKTTTSNTHKQQVLFIRQINLAYKLKLNRYEINEKLNTSPLQVSRDIYLLFKMHIGKWEFYKKISAGSI